MTMNPAGGRYDLDDWLESHLFDRRIVVVRGPLDHEAATRAASKLMTLDATSDDGCELQLDSGGGPLEAALAIVDVIDAMGVAVHAKCLGRVEGAAVAVAAVCNRRTAMPHTRFRLSDPPVEIEGRASDIGHQLEYQQALLGRYHDRLAEATGQSREATRAACDAGRYMDAGEALAFGLIDEVEGRRRAVIRGIKGGRDDGGGGRPTGLAPR